MHEPKLYTVIKSGHPRRSSNLPALPPLASQRPNASRSSNRPLCIGTKVVRDGIAGVRLGEQLAAVHHLSMLGVELCQTCLDLWSEVTHETLDRPGGSITQGANGVPLDLFSGRQLCSSRPPQCSRQLEQHVNLPLLRPTLDHAVHHVHHPSCALSARCALATRLVLVEFGESGNGRNHVGGVVHDDDSTSAERCLVVFEGVVVHPDPSACSLSGDAE